MSACSLLSRREIPTVRSTVKIKLSKMCQRILSKMELGEFVIYVCPIEPSLHPSFKAVKLGRELSSIMRLDSLLAKIAHPPNIYYPTSAVPKWASCFQWCEYSSIRWLHSKRDPCIQLMSSDCRTGRCSGVNSFKKVSTSPLNRSLPTWECASEQNQRSPSFWGWWTSLPRRESSCNWPTQVLFPCHEPATTLHRDRVDTWSEARTPRLWSAPLDFKTRPKSNNRTCSPWGIDHQSCTGKECLRRGCVWSHLHEIRAEQVLRVST